jgi:hypothetical protein
MMMSTKEYERDLRIIAGDYPEKDLSPEQKRAKAERYKNLQNKFFRRNNSFTAERP